MGLTDEEQFSFVHFTCQPWPPPPMLHACICRFFGVLLAMNSPVHSWSTLQGNKSNNCHFSFLGGGGEGQ